MKYAHQRIRLCNRSVEFIGTPDWGYRKVTGTTGWAGIILILTGNALGFSELHYNPVEVWYLRMVLNRTVCRAVSSQIYFTDMYLVGVDCSTKPKNVGIALAEIGDVVRVWEVHAGIGDPWDRVANWLLTHREETIPIALDAPLGWPVALGQALQDHSAGKPEDRCPDDMFRRSTDRHIKEMVGKQPLDVGADRIARTAHSALKYLRKV